MSNPEPEQDSPERPRDGAADGPPTQRTRYALVKSPRVDVEPYLPNNYRVLDAVGSQCVILGRDTAGWTLDEYVLPRLATGGHHGEEIDAATASTWDGEVGTTTTSSEGFVVVAREYADATAEAWVYLADEEIWRTRRQPLARDNDLRDLARSTLRQAARRLSVAMKGM